MQTTRRLTASLVLAALALGGMTVPARAQDQHWSVPLRAQIAQLNTVEWRLAVVAAPRCDRQSAGTGLALDSLAAYPASERAAIVAALGMADGVVVAAVAPGSPADLANVRPGDRLVAIAGDPVEQLGTDAPDLIAEAASERLAALPIDGVADLTFQRGGDTLRVAIVPQARCAPRGILHIADRVDAWSDHDNYALTTGTLGYVSNDHELALISGHELAHIILAPELAAKGIRNKRKEAAADKLGAEIAACAGYDLTLASQFWARFDSTQLLGFLPTLTHPRSKNRQNAVAAMAPAVDCTAFASAAI